MIKNNITIGENSEPVELGKDYNINIVDSESGDVLETTIIKNWGTDKVTTEKINYRELFYGSTLLVSV